MGVIKVSEGFSGWCVRFAAIPHSGEEASADAPESETVFCNGSLPYLPENVTSSLKSYPKEPVLRGF
jgi:hypothetical protein